MSDVSEDHLQIQAVVSRLTMQVDLCEFDTILDLFTEDAVANYSETWGEGYDGLPIAEFMAHIRGIIPGFDATQHLVSNFDIVVKGDAATSRCHVNATQVLDGRHWVIASVYLHDLVRTPDGWRMKIMGKQTLYESGERDLVTLAAQRVAAGFERKRGPAALHASARQS